MQRPGGQCGLNERDPLAVDMCVIHSYSLKPQCLIHTGDRRYFKASSRVPSTSQGRCWDKVEGHVLLGESSSHRPAHSLTINYAFI